MSHHPKFIKGALLTITCAAAFGQASANSVIDTYKSMFSALPEVAVNPNNEITEAKVQLGRLLYFENRISIGQKLSCNSCHDLEAYGQDNLPFSPGHDGSLGGRSSPSVYNAAIHLAQFWDGRAPDVEEQAKGPVLNPVEMGMPDSDTVIKVLKSIPGYQQAFKEAFPGQEDPITYDNFGNAIGAFERKLMTPSPWDAFLKGADNALTAEQKKGFETFATTGCTMCHNGAGVGGHLYQKLGLVKPWPNLTDEGRAAETKNPADKHMFKVASLRNITETAPYSHNGAVTELKEMVRLMGEHQLGKNLTEEEINSIVAFLGSLKGTPPKDLIGKPELPTNGPDTPKPLASK